MKKNKANQVNEVDGGMSKANDHTPTPWTDQKGDLIGADGTMVDAREEANTEFMLRAVNAHEALLEAAKFALSVTIKNGLYDMSDKMAAEKLGKAIAQAKNGGR